MREIVYLYSNKRNVVNESLSFGRILKANLS